MRGNRRCFRVPCLPPPRRRQRNAGRSGPRTRRPIRQRASPRRPMSINARPAPAPKSRKLRRLRQRPRIERRLQNPGCCPPAKKTTKECRAGSGPRTRRPIRAKGITEKAYVDQCKAGTAAITPPAAPAQTKMAPPKAAPVENENRAAGNGARQARGQDRTGSCHGPACGCQSICRGRPSRKTHCPAGTGGLGQSQFDKIFHFAGHADYGHTKNGAYMCETDATAQGMRAAKNEKRP